jgi:pimeloyl-ACP methyl ester carboxylesterase
LPDLTAAAVHRVEALSHVIPSLPGYGFSGKPATTGWVPDRIASAWAVLMKRLGYTRYVAQGGDWGAIITDVMATGCERRTLCGLGTAETFFRRSSRRLQIAACIAEYGMFAMPSAYDLNKIADSFWRVMFNHPQLSPMGPADIVCEPLI